MTCLAPGLVYNKSVLPEGALHPEEFGFIFDQVATHGSVSHTIFGLCSKSRILDLFWGPTHICIYPLVCDLVIFVVPKVSSLLVLNSTPFTHYPNPIFDPLGNSGILEVKPGSPIILKVRKHLQDVQRRRK